MRILSYLTTLIPFRKSHCVDAVLGTVRDRNLDRKLTARTEIFRGFSQTLLTTAHHSTYPHNCTPQYLSSQLHTTVPLLTTAHHSTSTHNCTPQYLSSQLHTTVPLLTTAHHSTSPHNCTPQYLEFGEDSFLTHALKV